MGDRGPVGKRSNQKHGHRTKEELGAVTKAPGASGVAVPRADPKWHPIAKRIYASLGKSGQRVFFEPSDWATAYLIAESISRDLNPQFLGINERTGDVEYGEIPLKGASLSAYLKAFGSLLMTEGDRRRARLELQRGPDVDADEVAAVAAIDDYRDRLRSS